MTDTDLAAPLILFVDDEATAVKYFQRAIGALAPVVTAGSVEEGKRMLDKHADTITVLVSDQRMPGEYGNELLFYAREQYPTIVRILTTAYSELEHTVEAVNQGQIHRYIQKPWDIAALRMEMKQALELAALRKEHDQLLREKLLIRQKQTVSNRIGAISVLCACLSGTEQFHPVENYLMAAHSAGLSPPEPDWLLMDYADLVSAEASRSGAFGFAVHSRLEQLKRTYPDYQGQRAFDVLVEEWGRNKVKRTDDDAVVLTNECNLAEFLETPSLADVSPQHATWLALLIWLDGVDCPLQITEEAGVVVCRRVPKAVPHSAERLAAWIEQF
jgi:two-component system probable response regulator PhcQ